MTGHRFFIALAIVTIFMAGDIHASGNAGEAGKRVLPGDRDTRTRLVGRPTDKDRIAKRIEKLKKEIEWVKLQREQYQTYIARQEKDLTRLKRQKDRIRRFEMELSPYLAEVTAKLEAFIRNDLDFLPEERARRISFLKNTLSDYHLDQGEKLRRVMEALQVEAGYGRGVETTDAEILLDGRPTQVELLRLGRIALYFRTPDGRQMGYRTKDSESWIPLPAKYVRSLKKAFAIAEGRRATELVTLPVLKGEE